MVKIKKGDLNFEVTYDVFKSHYEKNGWKIHGSKKTDRDSGRITETEENENPSTEIDLMSMNLSELREYADKNGIDISEASTKKEIRAIIESAIDI